MHCLERIVRVNNGSKANAQLQRNAKANRAAAERDAVKIARLRGAVRVA